MLHLFFGLFLVLITGNNQYCHRKNLWFCRTQFQQKIGLIKIFLQERNFSNFAFYYCRSFSLQQIFFTNLFQSSFIYHKMQSPIKLYQQAFYRFAKKIFGYFLWWCSSTEGTMVLAFLPYIVHNIFIKRLN